ncbi:MAG: BBP7 family outer membrane beta-barrel protein [Pirellulales bacterium]|nr:BBP7 family outer membrane beta-barrel protein [Pirellulales bacterium]
MSPIKGWHGWLAVLLLIAVSAPEAQPAGLSGDGTADRAAAGPTEYVPDALAASDGTSMTGVYQADAAVAGNYPTAGPSAPWCMNEPNCGAFDRPCGFRSGCDPGWFPIGRITCKSPPHAFWYGEVTAVGLKRNAEPAGGPIATLDTPDNVVLRAADAWPDFRAGGMVRLGRMFTPTWGIEYGYLGAGTWEGDAAVRDQTPNTPGGLGNLFSPFGGFGAAPVDDFDYNELVSIHGSTRLSSFELSLRNRLCMPPEPLQVSVFYGIRYIDLTERFDYYSQTQVPLPVGATQWVDVHAENDLFGVQIGTLMEWHIEPTWWFDARLSAGLYNNRASQTTHHIETGDQPGETLRANQRDRGSVGAEVSLALVYCVSPRLSTRVGYHFLWLDRVALAAENFEANPDLLRDGPAQLDAEGTIMFHGPFLGVALAW